MSIKQLAGIVFLIASAFSAYVPELLTRGENKLSGKELGEQYPERAWVRFVYPTLYMLIFFGAAFLFLISFSQSGAFLVSGNNWVFVIGGILGCIPLYNGLFCLLTGVIPVNRRQQYLYVINEESSHQVGFLLAGIGMGIIMAAAFAVLFWFG